MLAVLAAGDPPPAPPEPPEPPSAELLLFLAEFGDDEGRFVDPTLIDETAGDGDGAAPAAQDEDPETDDAQRDPPL